MTEEDLKQYEQHFLNPVHREMFEEVFRLARVGLKAEQDEPVCHPHAFVYKNVETATFSGACYVCEKCGLWQ